MKIAITGGTGFIGKRLVAKYLSSGHEVRVLTRNDKAGDLFPEARVFVGDLSRHSSVLRQFVSGVDVVCHLAAELHDEEKMQAVNVEGTARLLEVSRGQIKRWVQLSSTGVYGPVRLGQVDEDSDIRPHNPYEHSKATADALVLDAARGQGLSCVLLRPSNVYGADMPNQSLFQMIRMIDKGLFFFIGSRGAMVNYIHVEDVVDALLRCANSALSANGRAYIVSDHRPLEELVHIITARLGKAAPRLRLPELPVRALATACGWVPGFPLKVSRVEALTDRTIYRTDRIETELGHCNLVSMEAGIGELVRYWKNAAN